MQVEHIILDGETGFWETTEIPQQMVDVFRPFQFIDGTLTTAIRPNSYTIKLHAEGKGAVISCVMNGKTALTHLCCFDEAQSPAMFGMVQEIISGTEHPVAASPTVANWIYSIVIDKTAMPQADFEESLQSILFIYNALLLARQGDVRNSYKKNAN